MVKKPCKKKTIGFGRGQALRVIIHGATGAEMGPRVLTFGQIYTRPVKIPEEGGRLLHVLNL